ncbi:cilia- and flagella-associated protein HOATZ [Nerophis lumbriciformis]|uniref:cilia- and flagella-associated protein HOATZ n=1 Tax=Nerophis lumbriciformis TaxID=546530 RepID=UPI002AE08AC0|nr:cilia- and flagella-associated protein HOATZ-like [Nerophis lumbriciformis]XP_061837416.1 cilia- and flagella-associated protein HOATZ-like [Nerophis lumbriciformis]XP_061837417.1 cilia- and flagella-associated protein HOATZ-like [Nerophis lumbriciformis]XP_061837418.1 cilia- and flagella-associated protein HOATZ-like [Nerophis lumbriciformis]
MATPEPSVNHEPPIDVLTVFSGSSPEDVSHARKLWSSLCMVPPLESRLVSADIPQRLPVSRPGRNVHSEPYIPEPPNPDAVQRRLEERQKYMSMAAQRKETLALLRRQREQRIQKELLSAAFRPKPPKDKVSKEETSEADMDKELVRLLD